MKRIKLKSSLLAALAILCVLFSSAQYGETQAISLNKISDHLFEVMGGKGANGGIHWR